MPILRIFRNVIKAWSRSAVLLKNRGRREATICVERGIRVPNVRVAIIMASILKIMRPTIRRKGTV